MTLIFYPTQTDFEKVEKIIFKNVSEHSNESKNASMTFRDILPKEQFYELLWGLEVLKLK
jgi:hypothetical protein